MFKPSERIALAALDRPAAEAEWLRLVEVLHTRPGFWWLDSALQDNRLGQLSFAGSDPYLWLRSEGNDVEIEVLRAIRPGLAPGTHRTVTDPMEAARAILPRADSVLYSTRSAGEQDARGWHEVAGLSAGIELPFLAGAVGYFGYELGERFEPRMKFDLPNDLGLADLSLAFVDRVVAYDHADERLWLVGLGFGDGRAPNRRQPRERALERSRGVVDRLERYVESALAGDLPANADGTSETVRGGAPFLTRRSPNKRGPVLGDDPADRLAEETLTSTTDASGYAKSVEAIRDEIAKGNVYQANYSQRFSIDAPLDPWRLYAALRRHNPAPFGAYLKQPGGAAILSSSPERFLRVDAGRQVESRPIKGTRPRGETEALDAKLAAELAASEKDRAENLMIVDLVRNDLGRVCAPGSIEVPELMKIEPYAAVFQMVSTVKGVLATGRDSFDLIEATFPPGSMTGAPKLASTQLLERLETVRRGVYAGALGYLDLRGGLDLSVVIRTFIWQDGRAHLHVGGGVVADSSPEGEYFESLDKARAPLEALATALAEERAEAAADAEGTRER